MAWTTLKTVKVFQLFGVPKLGDAFDTRGLSTLYGPFGETYDFTAVATNLTTQITNATADADILTQLEALIDRLDTIGYTSPIQIWRGSGGSEGTLADYAAEREAIRQQIGNLIGFSAPKGGYMRERGQGGGCGISR